MSKENNIKKGLLSDKMSNFSVEAPEGAWENISSQLGSGSPRRYLFIALAAAAGLALAITVGINLIDRSSEQSVVANNSASSESKAEIKELESNEIISSESAENNENIDRKPSKLEEKVLIAMEEVIDEMEIEEGIVVTENLGEEPKENSLAVTQTDSESDELAETDPGQEEIDQLYENNSQQADDEQAKLDSIASQNYLDSLSNISQVNDEFIVAEKDDNGKWQIGASLSPIFSYRDASSQDLIQNQAVNNSERGRLSYSGGVQFSYLSSERLSIESGVYYNRMGLAIGDFTRFESNLDFLVGAEAFYDNSIVSLSNSIGTIDTKNEDVFVNAYSGDASERWAKMESTDLPASDMVLQDEVVNSFEQSLEYLEIPFNLKYKVINRDFKVLLIGGISTNLLVGNSVTANTINGKLDYGSVQDIRTVSYSGNAGLGFLYSFTGNLSLSVEPRFRYFLNSINEASLPTTRPYVMGLYTGVNYTF